MRRTIAIALAGSILSILLLISTSAGAACAADPDALTFGQMIRREETGVKGFHVLLLGKVVVTNDLAGGPGGRTIAKLAVAAHPVGWGPLVSRIRFWRDPPGVGTEDNFEFSAGDLYAVVARHHEDGSFDFDGGCGQTSRLTASRFKHLVTLADQQ